jgi:curved DNA-binding protein CbpA
MHYINIFVRFAEGRFLLMNGSENTSRFMMLFGLSEGFSPEELSSAYHTLAKLNHPDANPNPESKMRMVIINEAYSYLKEHGSSGFAPILSADSKKYPDPAYDLYKSAFSIMSKAFTNYYGEGDKTLTDDINYLTGELSLAKKGFAECINTYPKSSWTADAIDRVFSINKWLES